MFGVKAYVTNGYYRALAAISGRLKPYGELDRFDGLPITVEYVDGIKWRLYRQVTYISQSGDVITVPEGFVYDFASIPRPLYWLYPPCGDGRNSYGIAATIHDVLYYFGKVNGRTISRLYADRMFLEVMRYIGVRRTVAGIMYAAVRVGGWSPWRNYRKREMG